MAKINKIFLILVNKPQPNSNQEKKTIQLFYTYAKRLKSKSNTTELEAKESTINRPGTYWCGAPSIFYTSTNKLIMTTQITHRKKTQKIKHTRNCLPSNPSNFLHLAHSKYPPTLE